MIHSFEGKTPRFAASAFISEAAYIIGDVEIGENCGIFPGAILRADFAHIKIGNGTMIEDNCVIHSGTGVDIGERNTIGHGVIVHCSSIGNNCLIGNNATLLDDAKIGNFCVIGAGCLVTKGMQVPDYSMVVGVPGVIKGEISRALRARLERGSSTYAKLIVRYKKQPGFEDRSVK